MSVEWGEHLHPLDDGDRKGGNLGGVQLAEVRVDGKHSANEVGFVHCRLQSGDGADQSHEGRENMPAGGGNHMRGKRIYLQSGDGADAVGHERHPRVRRPHHLLGKVANLSAKYTAKHAR
eukprot:652887-Prorocentrum_minimum.AAC.2